MPRFMFYSQPLKNRSDQMNPSDALFAAFVQAIGPSAKNPAIARLIKQNLKLRKKRRAIKAK